MDKVKVRTTTTLSWGTKEQCKNLFIDTFIEVDKTIEVFEYLPEYDQIIDWMADTNGKGLCLMGDCGRGKSTILEYVMPVLFAKLGKGIRSVSAREIGLPCDVSWTGNTKIDRDTINLDYLLCTRFPMIDEIGKEEKINIYGNKIDGVALVIEIAEKHIKPLFLTTNLTGKELSTRYGLYILDRIRRLCKIVKFKGKSYRK